MTAAPAQTPGASPVAPDAVRLNADFAATPAERLHALDALRGLALLLGVLLHASLSFFPAQVWIVADDSTSGWAVAVFFAIHMFRMTAFFLIAGLFAHMMLGRKGLGGFVKDRLIRIAGPLLAFWLPVMAGIITALVWTAHVNGLVVPGAPPPPPPTYDHANFPLTHLWFLWTLLILYAAWLILRAPFALLDRTGAWGRITDRLTGVIAGPAGPFLLAAPLTGALWLHADWIAMFGVPTPDEGLIPNVAALTAFGLAFLFGALLDRRRGLLGRIAAWAPLHLAVALASGWAAFHLSGAAEVRLSVMTDPQLKLHAAAAFGLGVFSSVFAVTGLSIRAFSRHSAVRRYLADASYWIYIVHLPLIMLAQVWVQDWPWPWWVKLPLVTLVVTGLGLASYELLVRHGFMGRWLNGRRIPWRRALQPSAAGE